MTDLMTTDSVDVDKLLDTIDELVGEDFPEEDELDELIDLHHASTDEANAYFHARDSYSDGFDDGQAEVALDLMLQIPEYRVKELVRDVARRLQWAVAIVDQGDLIDNWQAVYVDPPTDQDLDELFDQAFWPVWVEAEMKLAARDTMQDLIAPDPDEAWEEPPLPLDAPSSDDEDVEADPVPF